MIILVIWTAVIIAAVILYFRQNNSRFYKYGVKFVKPLPILGNMGGSMLRMRHMAYDMLDLYNMFLEERFVGRFEFTKEVVMICDLDLVKQICVKDFEYFLDHRPFFSESNSFFSRNLFSLKGQEWKDMRSTLNPAFTSSKIRVMVPFMIAVGEQMMTMLKSKIKDSEEDYIEIDCKDLTTRYANDVIATCTFGLEINSHMDEHNQFYARAKESSTFGFRQMMMFFLMLNFPGLGKFFKWDFLTTRSKQFFRDLVINTIKYRELNHIVRPDMIHLLMKAKEGQLTHETDKSKDAAAGFATVEESTVGASQNNRKWTDEDIIGQAVGFFIAGFESVSSAMCFLLFELAVNPDIQDRLAKEIRDHDAKNGGKFDFNSIQSMTYLDMVTSELLRLWPPGVILDRQCTKDYNLGKPNKNAEKDFIVRKGTGITIPVFAFHRDPKFFPNPEKFDPERFAEENRHNLHPYAYMPFGVGARNCIGSRFALCETKAIVYQILLHLEVAPCQNTRIPGRLSGETFNMKLEDGHHLRFKIRP